MKKKIYLVALFSITTVLTSCGGEDIAGTENTDESAVEVSTSSEVGGAATSEAEASFTMAEVQVHNSESSCYSTIGGKVYDLTSYIPNHPGGVRDIMKVCGRDGESIFNDQHEGAPDPAAALEKLYIGTLQQ